MRHYLMAGPFSIVFLREQLKVKVWLTFEELNEKGFPSVASVHGRMEHKLVEIAQTGALKSNQHAIARAVWEEFDEWPHSERGPEPIPQRGAAFQLSRVRVSVAEMGYPSPAFGMGYRGDEYIIERE